jgi:polysaccharide biosynthesis protein PslF
VNDEKYHEYLSAFNVGLLPYTRTGQSSSGVLCQLIGVGRVVICSPFQHALALAEEVEGIVIANRTTYDGFQAMETAMKNRNELGKAMTASYNYAQRWDWSRVACAYRGLGRQALKGDRVER